MPSPEKSIDLESVAKPSAERPDARRIEARLSTLDVRVALLEQEVGLLKLARKAAQEAQVAAPQTAPRLAPAPSAPIAAPVESRGPAFSSPPLSPASPPPAQPAQNGASPTPPASPSPPKPESHRINVEEARPADGTPISEAVEKEMARILATCRAGEVAIHVREGSIEANGFGAWLQRVFVAGGWRVKEIEALAMPPEKEGISLCFGGGSAFPKSAAAAIQRALLAAGISLSFALDPTSKSPVPVLIAPQWPRDERRDA